VVGSGPAPDAAPWPVAEAAPWPGLAELGGTAHPFEIDTLVRPARPLTAPVVVPPKPVAPPPAAAVETGRAGRRGRFRVRLPTLFAPPDEVRVPPGAVTDAAATPGADHARDTRQAGGGDGGPGRSRDGRAPDDGAAPPEAARSRVADPIARLGPFAADVFAARPDRARVARAVTRGVASAVFAVAAGLAVGALLVLVVALCGVGVGGFDDVAGSARVVGGVWLAAHHVGFEVIEVTHTATGSVEPIVTVVPVRLAPLGLTVPLVWLLHRIARRVADGVAGTAITLGVQALVYGALLYAVAAGTEVAAVRPVGPTLAQAAVGVALVGVLGALGPLVARAPAIRAGLVAGAVLAAGGAVVVVACLLAHVDDVRVALGAGAHDAAGFAALTLLCMALVPDAIVWAAAYGAGTGFALGAATTVAPTGITLGALPALPLLAALPADTSSPPAAWSPLALPVLAGVAAGLLAARAVPPRTWLAASGHAVGAAATTGVLALAATTLASGGAGVADLAELGPDPWRTAAVLGAEIASIAVPTALAATWWRGRERVGAAPAEAGTAPPSQTHGLVGWSARSRPGIEGAGTPGRVFEP